MRRASWLAPVVVLACSGKPAPKPAAPPARAPHAVAPPAPPPDAAVPAPVDPHAVRVSLADVGLEAASLDRSADPCLDFYQFACGGWIQAVKLPDDRARWARFSELEEKNAAILRGLLDDAARAPVDASARTLGDFYAACRDDAAERATSPLYTALLDKARGVKDAKTWLAALVALHQVGVPAVFATVVGPDYKDSLTAVTQYDAAGLGLPDRDYYLAADRAPTLQAYREHLVRLFALGGADDAKARAAADDVVAIETELAKLTKTAVERRDVPASYNVFDARSLAKQTRSIDWPAYWKGVGAPPSKKLVVGTPKFFAGLDGLRAKFPPARWASYFTAHALAAFAFAGGKAIDAEMFQLQRVLTGVAQPRERAKRCVDLTGVALADTLGAAFAAKQFPGSSKQTASELVDAIAKAMSARLAALDWMSPPTRALAQQKLAKIVRMIGYPEPPRAYRYDVKRDDFAGNALRAAAFLTHRELAKAGGKVDRAEWQMSAFTVNAYYEPTMNNTALPAGILQPPFFGQDRQIAANLGGIGMVIGHELTHAFDDEGAQFDGDGNLKNWWTKDDKAKFDARAQCVADQYATFEAAPKQFVNGKLTLGEDIADLGGVKMAFDAYRALRAGAAKVYVADGLSEDQQFFLAVGQAWCDVDRPAEVLRRLTVDPHAPPRFRVYGALRNLPEFAQAFACAEGTPMRPTTSCTVW